MLINNYCGGILLNIVILYLLLEFLIYKKINCYFIVLKFML